jgi:hypothetical protein
MMKATLRLGWSALAGPTPAYPGKETLDVKKACQIVGMALITAVAFGGQAHADITWFLNPDNSHYYGVTLNTETWAQAEAQAVSLGGHLASVTSQNEENFLINTFVVSSTPGGSLQPLWIGLYDANFSPNTANRNFVWTTGEPVSYTDWNPGEPNNNGGNEWYVAFNFHYAFGQTSTKGTWNDTTLGGSVSGPYRGIIELNFNPTAVPEPGPLALAGVAAAVGAGVQWRRRRRAG